MKLNTNTIKLLSLSLLVLIILGGFALNGKKDENSPGVEFMPDMYRSPSVEVYGTSMLNGDEIFSTQFTPAKGSIARGYMPYAYPNTNDGYEAAGLYLKNPIPVSDKVLADAEALYTKNCVHCHGASGAGDGKVGQKLPGAPPAYNGALKNLPEGKIFHSITYGKGLMGNHASILTAEERWKLVHYVQKLQGPKETAPADSTKAPAPAAEVKKEEKTK
jgi:mono/diheme cytochrome c family protein